MSLNKAIIMGNLGRDVELKYTPSGKAVANFSIATSESWKDKSGQKQEKTQWHNIVAWGSQAEHCDHYLAKGSQVLIEGRIETRSWDDKDGNKKYTTEIIANNVQFIGKKENKQSDSFDSKPEVNQAFTSEDIPF